MATLPHLVRIFAYKVIRFIAFSRGKRRQLSLSTRILRQMWAIRPSFVTDKLKSYRLKPATPAFSLSIQPISPSHQPVRPRHQPTRPHHQPIWPQLAANAAATSVNSAFCGRGVRTTSSFRPSSCRQKAERSPGGCSLPSRRTCPYGQSPPWCSCWRRA